MEKSKKKTIKRVIAIICIVAVVGVLAAMPLIAKQEPEKEGTQASILSGNVEVGSIDRKLMGGGTLTQEASVAISVPVGVKLEEFLVSNGEFVTEGTAIATVDRVTLMNAIVSVQETLDYLSGEIEEAKNAEEETEVSALAGGIVKIIYAQEGDSVQNVMLEHGALAVLSLDGLMAVDLETDSTLVVMTEVTVTLSDGTAVSGKVERNLLGEMTVTMEDNSYAVGETVEIATTDGTVLGSGQLYIYSPWNATAYAGVVETVEVSVEDSTEAGDPLLTLSNVGNSALYGQLVGQRIAYEGFMAELTQLYRAEVITAPCDGVITGIDTSSAQLLEAMAEEASEDASTLMYGAVQEENYGIVLLSNTTVRMENETTEPVATEPAPTEGDGNQNSDTQTPGNQGSLSNPTGGSSFGGMTGGMSGFGGSVGGFTGGFSGSFGGTTGSSAVETEPEFELYSTELTDIAAVTPMDSMDMKITVDEMDITALELGMIAEIRIDALGGEKISAIITDIGNTGTGNGGNSKFTVTLTMERGENMLPGMTATAKIVLSTTADILTVPASALVEDGNQTMIYTAYDEEMETLLNPVVVEVGISDGNTVEILSGLAEGQSYYYAYYDTPEISYMPDFGSSGGFGFFGR